MTTTATIDRTINSTFGVTADEFDAVIRHACESVGVNPDDDGERAGLVEVWADDPSLFRDDRDAYLASIDDDADDAPAEFGPADAPADLSGVDTRSAVAKSIDSATGTASKTRLDKHFDKCLSAAVALHQSPTAMRMHLTCGMRDDKYLLIAEEMGTYSESRNPRATGVERLRERYVENGLASDDLRINDHIAVYHLCRLLSGKSKPSEMPDDLMRIGYRNFAIMKVGVERSGLEYVWRDGWQDMVRGWIRDGVRGEKLSTAVKQHKEKLSRTAAESELAGLTDDERKSAENAAAVAAAKKARETVEKAAEKLRDVATKAKINPDGLLDMLVNTKVVPSRETSKIDPATFARAINPDNAADFARAMIDRGDYRAVFTMTAVLRGWLQAQPEAK